MAKSSLIGIPISEVGDRLRNLGECLKQYGMALKADTGVHINCDRDGETAVSCALEVYMFEKEEEKKMANKKADFKIDDTEEIKKQDKVENCWFDDKDGLFHCLMKDGSEWVSSTGSAQGEWLFIKFK